MNLSEDTIRDIWIKRYGNNAWAKDCYGAWIYFYDRGRECKPRTNPDGVIEPCGWEIDHIYPESKGGTNNEYNLEFAYGYFNSLKADQLRYKLTGNTIFSIRKRPYKNGYGIYNESKQKFVDWISTH